MEGGEEGYLAQLSSTAAAEETSRRGRGGRWRTGETEELMKKGKGRGPVLVQLQLENGD